jgi:hypothetical protein
MREKTAPHRGRRYRSDFSIFRWKVKMLCWSLACAGGTKISKKKKIAQQTETNQEKAWVAGKKGISQEMFSEKRRQSAHTQPLSPVKTACLETPFGSRK